MSKEYMTNPIRHIGEKEQPLPKYLCRTCGRCDGTHCLLLNRYVEPDYNRCFKHTNYTLGQSTFKTSNINKEDLQIA